MPFPPHRYRFAVHCVLLASALAQAAGAQTPVARTPSSTVRVSIQVDSVSTALFDADNFDLKVASAGIPGANAEIQLVKQAGPWTAALLTLSGRRIHAPTATIEVLDSLGTATVTFRLSDVTVVSQRIALADNRTSLEQQSISQQEALSSLNADYQEAARQLATAEELAKSRVGTRLELARARDKVSDLQRRIDLLKERQARLSRQLAGSGLEESLVLHFGQLEMESKDGSRAIIEGMTRIR